MSPSFRGVLEGVKDTKLGRLRAFLVSVESPKPGDINRQMRKNMKFQTLIY
jgi:hypothetical protein